MERKRRKDCRGWTFCLLKSSFWKTEMESPYTGWHGLSSGLEAGKREKRTNFIYLPGKQTL